MLKNYDEMQKALKELLEKENLSYMYDFHYYGRYRIKEILIDYYVKQRRIPY